jgi:hypothetical protein
MKPTNQKSQAENKPEDSENLFEESDLVYKYTSEQAEEDGVLFDISKANPLLGRGRFRYITVNLLKSGYLNGDEVNAAGLLDLTNQCLLIVQHASNNFKDPDWFYSGSVELPSGKMQKVFIAQNETGKYTIMLPEDY